jgi:hypothetical protein
MAGSVSPRPLHVLGDSPFACPRCRVALDFEHRLECPRRGTRYQAADGVASFNDAGLHHGPILPKAQMAEILALEHAKRVAERFVPLTGTRHELRAALAAVKPARTVTGFCWHAAARLGLVPWLAPQYVMVAER